MEKGVTQDRVIQVVGDYIEYVLDSPLEQEVKFGCDCGCGGDYYSENPQEWDRMIKDRDLAIEEFMELCGQLDINS